MVGHCLSELFPDYRASGVFDRYCRVVETGESFTKEIEVSDPAAPEKWLEMKVVRHGDGVAVTTSDISERKLFEQVMHDSEKRFRLLAENAGDLIFRLDLDGTFLYVSPAAREILGCEPSTLMGARLIASVGAEDAARVEAVLHTLASAEIDEATVTCRVQHKDGRRLRTEGKLRLLRDAGSRAPLEIQGTLRDISERCIAEDALRMNEARLVAATESIHDSFTVFEAVRDAEGRIVDFRYAFINAVGAQAVGRTAEELRGQLLCQIAPRTRSNGFFERCLRVFETGEPANGELCINRLGEDLWVDFKIVRVGDRGEIAVTYRDISERKRHEFLLQESEARMRQMAHHDGLTHLPNRTLFFERINEAMARAYRSEKPLVVMFIDVDHFKRFNDTYGHAGGDEVLKVVARRLSAAVRASDTVARFAGDEFTLVLESVRNVDDVRLIGEKLLDIMRAPITLGASQVRVTLSIGAAFLEGGTATVDTMMTTADTALYEVKQNGRDGFRVLTVGALDGAMRDKPLPAEWFDQLTLGETAARK
jgi:diguanylate cyclase (GGDEF)-like protein/PAS domain S-box-containing protein